MIQLTGIDLRYEQRQVFKDFGLRVCEKEKVLLSAPSGAGKSSLFRMLLGFETPDQGTIELDGDLLGPNTVATFRKKIAYVSQDVDFPDQGLGDLIQRIFSYPINRHLEVTAEKAGVFFNEFGLDQTYPDKRVGQLSGGERQRLGLTVALLLDRPVLLLDEVTSGLDEPMKQKIVSHVLGLDQTVIVISHDREWDRPEYIRKVSW